MLNRSQQPLLKDFTTFSLRQPECRKLPNGVKLYLLDSGDVDVTRVDLVFDVGKMHQSQLLQALFTNRMLREGTQRMNRAEIAEKLDFYGAWMEQNVSFCHSFVTLYSLNKYLPQTLDILAQIVKEPVFDAQALEVVVQNNVQRFLVALAKTAAQARRAFKKSIYGRHLLGQMADEADYYAVNREALVDYYRRFYHSGNLSIYLAGHITDECLQRVEALFGEPFGSQEIITIHQDLQVPQLPATHQFFEVKNSVQSSVLIGKSTISMRHPDSMKLRVLLTLFGGYFGSRLMNSVREEKGYTYGIFSVLNPSPFDNALMILCDCAHEYVNPLLEEVYHQIDLLQQEPVSEEELSIVRSCMKGEILRSYESRLSLTDAWILVHTLGLPDTWHHDFWHEIDHTTPADLLRLAQTYLCKETLTEIVVGQKNS